MKNLIKLLLIMVIIMNDLFSQIEKTSLTPTEGYIETTHGKTWYSIYGKDKTGIPLILVHGGPGATHYYLEPLKELADERPVIFYDQLGCGNSKEIFDNNFMTVEYFVEELSTLISELNLNKYHLWGNSWGTMLITEFYHSKKPSNVKSIIFSGAFLSTQLWIDEQIKYVDQLPDSLKDVIKDCERSGDFGNPKYQEAMTIYYQKHLCRINPWPEYLNKAFDNFGAEVYNTMWGPSEFTVTGTLRDADVIDKFSNINLPILLTCGEFDESTPEANKHFASLNSNAKVVVIEDASHEHHIEKSAEYLKILRNFFILSSD